MTENKLTEYKSELVEGMGYLVYGDFSELPLSRIEVEYTLNAQEKLIHTKDKQLKKIAKLLGDTYPILHNLTNEGLIDILEKIMLIVYNREIGIEGELE